MLLNVNKRFMIYLNRVTIIDKNKEASLFLIKQ